MNDLREPTSSACLSDRVAASPGQSESARRPVVSAASALAGWHPEAFARTPPRTQPRHSHLVFVKCVCIKTSVSSERNFKTYWRTIRRLTPQRAL